MNGNEVCVPVVRGRGCRLVSRILPPQLFAPEFGGGERALTRGKSSRNRHRIGVRSLSRAIEFTFGLTFSNGSRLKRKYSNLSIYVYV